MLLNRYRLNPAETIFFDDREKNIIAAQDLGMKAVIFTGEDAVMDVLKS